MENALYVSRPGENDYSVGRPNNEINLKASATPTPTASLLREEGRWCGWCNVSRRSGRKTFPAQGGGRQAISRRDEFRGGGGREEAYSRYVDQTEFETKQKGTSR